MYFKSILILVYLVIFVNSKPQAEKTQLGIRDVLVVKEIIPEARENNGENVPLDVGGPINPRSVASAKAELWTDKTMFYKIDSSLDTRKDVIIDAMKHIEAETCIQFKEKSTNNANYINFYKGTGCNSRIGMVGHKQDLSLGEGCYSKGTIIHEILHALGFKHEHQKPGRNAYVTILSENIEYGREPNFDELSKSQARTYRNLPFDFKSIMMYSNYAFSRNNRPTIVAKDGRELVHASMKNELSILDVRTIKKFYSC